MRRGEAKFRASLQQLRLRRRWPRLTPTQWFRLALLVLGIVAALLGIEGEIVQSLIGALVK